LFSRSGAWSLTGCSGVAQILPDPLVPTRLYALVHGYEWMRSNDSGRTWALLGQAGDRRGQPATLVPDPRVRDRLYWGVQTGTQVFASNRAGDPPWRLHSSDAIGPFYDTWMTLDGEGNLLVQPEWYVNVFLRRQEQGWDRFELQLPNADIISSVAAGGALPGRRLGPLRRPARHGALAGGAAWIGKVTELGRNRVPERYRAGCLAAKRSRISSVEIPAPGWQRARDCAIRARKIQVGAEREAFEIHFLDRHENGLHSWSFPCLQCGPGCGPWRPRRDRFTIVWHAWY
jgi:hypothetical protein